MVRCELMEYTVMLSYITRDKWEVFNRKAGCYEVTYRYTRYNETGSESEILEIAKKFNYGILPRVLETCKKRVVLEIPEDLFYDISVAYASREWFECDTADY